MPVYGKSLESPDGSFNLYTFSVKRITEYENTCYAYILTTDTCIQRDS
jgi:hypothetical protein